MALPELYARALNLPSLPQSVMDQINFNYQDYLNYNRLDFSPENCMDNDLLPPDKKRNTHSHINTELLDEWCRENVSESMSFFWMLRSYRDQKKHKDTVTKTKLIYVIDTGGDNVTTTWYKEDQTTVLQHIQLQPHRWYILKTDMCHQVQGVEPDRIRFCVAGRVFS